MNILNMLHAPWLGGTEISFLNYCKAFTSNKKVDKLVAIIPKNAKIFAFLKAIKKVEIIENNKVYKNSRFLDFIFVIELRNLIKTHKIDIVFVNNGRLTKIAKRACKGFCKVVSVNHGTNPKKTALADYAFVLNRATYKEVEKHKKQNNNIFIIPNFIEMSSEYRVNKVNNEAPVIGVMGRFSAEKGFDHFLCSLKILKDNAVQFKALIGGDGNNIKDLKNLVENLKLNDEVEFLGWVTDKEEFFNKIDIFCLPSNEEAFGIVLLEAMKFKKPIVATNCNGPIEIIDDNETGVICKKRNPESIAGALQKFIHDRDFASKCATNAYEKLLKNYTSEIVEEKISSALEYIYKDFYK